MRNSIFLIRGVSLVELLVSLSIASILMLLLINFLMIVQKDFSTLLAEEQIFYQARQMENIFREAISHAGYLGCSTFSKQKIVSQLSQPFPINIPVLGFTSVSTKTWQPQLPQELAKQTKPQSDVLMLEFLQPDNSLLQQSLSDNHPIKLVNDVSIISNSIAIISDCQHAEAFSLEKGGKNNFPHPSLQYSYETNARFGRLEAPLFFIKQTSRNYFSHQPIFALYSQNGLQNSEELVEGIADMHIQYSDGITNFIPGNKVLDWDAIKKIKIAFTSTAALSNKLISKDFVIIFLLKNQ